MAGIDWNTRHGLMKYARRSDTVLGQWLRTDSSLDIDTVLQDPVDEQSMDLDAILPAPKTM